MEKISGIVKASPRLTSVDLKEAAPVRPGVPSFGRPEGISTLSQAPAFGATAPRSAGIQADQLDWRGKDAANAAIAAEMSNRFFLKNTVAAEPVRNSESVSFGPMHLPGVSSKPAGFKNDDIFREGSSLMPSSFEEDDSAEPMLQQPEGLYPKGSFIDRTA
jgi:hypothetical protein